YDLSTEPPPLLSFPTRRSSDLNSLAEMIREDLVAERIAIDSYREIIAWLGNDDPTTRRMLEEILAVEEEHADDLVRSSFPNQAIDQKSTRLNSSHVKISYAVFC